MSENREYLSQIQDSGAVHISEDVLTSLAGMAAAEVEGVASLTGGRAADLSDILTKKNAGKGVRLTVSEDNEITVDCSIVVKLGMNIMDVAKAVQEAITTSVESVTGFKLAEVNVTVSGIALPKEQKK